jgi:ComF family protein
MRETCFHFSMFLETITKLIFPPICVVCRARISKGAVCTACFASIAVRRDLVHNPDFPYALGAAAAYEDPVVQSLIHHLKFRGIRAAAAPLGDLLYNYTVGLSPGLEFAGCTVVPIPLSRRRERTRGYNQAELVARRFAERAGLALETDLLVRTRHTSPQSEAASIADRRENIRGAFAVADSAAGRAKICGANILLVDDVSTTGATFLDAARALEAASAARIAALAVAKT